MTKEVVQDQVFDPAYFATMMVYTVTDIVYTLAVIAATFGFQKSAEHWI